MIFFSNPYVNVFTAGFLSATLLPGGSEFLVWHYAPQSNFILLVFFATLGNTSGAFVNYIIGRWFSHLIKSKWLGQENKRLIQAETMFRKWGAGVLFFSFLPVIGDPLTAVAGLLKYPVPWFLLLVTAGKASRYALIAALA